MDEFMAALKKYADFTGRASRKDYWMFFLIYIVIYIVLTVLTAILPGILSSLFSILTAIFALGMLVPSLAVGARRLHDSDRSGWMLLIGLIPLVGALYVLYLLIVEGTAGDNRFGPSPVASIPNAV